MPGRPSLFWRLFAVNAGVLGVVALLLLLSPLQIDAPITAAQALIVLGGLAIGVIANAVLLRRMVSPLGRLARSMEGVDLLRPGRRLPAGRDDEVGRVVVAFNRMLDRLEDERRRSSARVVAAQEGERLGIARDLHDEVGQLLTGVLLQLEALVASTPAHRSELDEAKRAVRRALEEVRRISRGLRPEVLDELGLVSALTELSRTFAQVPGVRVERELEPSMPPLGAETELALYRVAQESLTNVARHAGASRVTISLRRDGERVVLQISDDGRGLSGAPGENGGLRGMRERALLVGGALAITPAAGGGVAVRLEVPLAPATDAEAG